ncbi:P-loop containing nucleoside triphosphate hydrolase protein [Lipomyces japonicus]|uniref:P-loop containing nucleoside triphosphate hydrolase protein n=1 Tax=Lipomyces japonicus TaxID=56871 RepID=UPI0034CF51FC
MGVDSETSSESDFEEKRDPVISVSETTPLVQVESDEFSGLPLATAEVLRSQVKVSDFKATFWTLYSFADGTDKALLVIAFVSSILSGVMRPLMTVVFGNITQSFTEIGSRRMDFGQEEYDQGYVPDFRSTVDRLATYFVYIGIADIVFSYIGTFLLMDRGEVLSARIREEYLRATLRQNIAYFDKLGSGEITTRISADTIVIQEGMSDKIGHLLQNTSTFVAAVVVAFIRSYKLTFILFSIIVFIVATVGIFSRFMLKYFRLSMMGYSVGGTLAEEVISSVRNVQAFGLQDRLAIKYDSYLAVTEKWGLRAGIALGSMIGVMWFSVYCNYSLSFWQGSRFLASNELNVGSVISVLMAMMMGTFSASSITPHLKNITNAIAAAAKIFATIHRASAIDSSDSSGAKLQSVAGEIELKNIKFIYPSRPDVVILNNFNLKIPSGKTVALVGSSGSGKSTIIGLIERFYSPVAGQITLDGHDTSNLNLKWLRQQFSLVSQEPVLFSCSIFENVAHGLIGTSYEFSSEVEKRELVTEACRQANALSFIENLPKGLDTDVGERGFLLSGGQKQRIAIARAVVSNPKILLLDEATSALDTKSEGVVQDALDKASKNRTTIVIAHRLSTIRDADCIVVMSRGAIVEMGTHNELLDHKAEYFNLVEAQKIETEKSEAENKLANKDDDVVENDNLDDAAILEKTVTRASARSVSSIALENKDTKEEKTYSVWELIVTVFKLSTPEHKWMFIGGFSAFINGLGYPVTSVLYANCIAAFQSNPSEYSSMRRTINLFAGLFFMLAFVESFAFVVTNGCLAYVAQTLVRRIRLQSFKQILRQDIAFFDKDENSTGMLTATLSRDAQSVEGLSGATLGQILNASVNVIAGLVLALSVAPKIAIVCAACVPVLIGCGYFRFSMQSRFEKQIKKSHGKSAAQACEAAAAIRTVVSLTREDDVWNAYHESLQYQIKASRSATNQSAFLYGMSQGISFFIMALSFWWGSRFLQSGEYSTVQFFITFIAMIMGSQAAGIVFSFAPDMGKAQSAAENIKRLMDSIPEVDAWSHEGQVVESVEGDIEFRDVHFRYPTRPHVPVLRGLNLSVKKGQYAALVGMSGCGKSTTISLIESFYRPLDGQVLLDGKDISTLEINSYRSHVALVQQEPVLYAGSIRENVLFGSLLPADQVSEKDLVAACKQANIHDFITSLPDGYDTMCGSKGILLSGGQKQRIAIARALIRNPKILLLDEATSALDSESEKVVQDALDSAAKGRTTIAVAHRLSTIQNADVIYVFDGGKVVEVGTHAELVKLQGKYFELVKLQGLDKTA